MSSRQRKCWILFWRKKWRNLDEQKKLPMRELSTIYAQNESSSQETASSVKEIKLITETVAEKAESIKDLSSKLGQMVGGFKV